MVLNPLPPPGMVRGHQQPPLLRGLRQARRPLDGPDPEVLAAEDVSVPLLSPSAACAQQVRTQNRKENRKWVMQIRHCDSKILSIRFKSLGLRRA